MVVCEVDLRRRNVGELKIEGWEVDEPTWGRERVTMVEVALPRRPSFAS